jgi:hypothetical protein
MENDLKLLATKKMMIQDERDRLKQELNERLVKNTTMDFEQNEVELENKGLVEKLKHYQSAYENEKANNKKNSDKLNSIKGDKDKEGALMSQELKNN